MDLQWEAVAQASRYEFMLRIIYVENATYSYLSLWVLKTQRGESSVLIQGTNCPLIY